MPEDALQEMVRTGALVRSDQVREGTDGEWRLASEIPELFAASVSVIPVAESVAPAPILPSSTESLIPPEAPTSSRSESIPVSSVPPVPADAPAIVAPSEPRLVEQPSVKSREAALSAEPPAKEDSPSRNAPPEDELIASWKSERARTTEELGMVSLAAEMTQAEDAEESPPELPADLLDDDIDEPMLSATSATSTGTSARSASQRSAFLDQIAGLESEPRRAAETTQQKWDRWRRSLPSLSIIIAVVVVLFAAWWFWPRSQRGIYDRYVAIWDEWKVRRTNLKDKEGWEQFIERTKSEMKDTVPWLEKHARATDREKQLLLWIGRDCFQRMLKRQPEKIGSDEEKQLEVFLQRLREFYRASGSGVSNGIPANSPPPSADPEHATGGGALDPNVIQKGAKGVPTTSSPPSTKSGVTSDEAPGSR